MIKPGIIDKLGYVNALLPSYLTGRNVKVSNSFFGTNSWKDVTAYPSTVFNNEINITPYPNEKITDALQINYSRNLVKQFNITLAYWDNTASDGVSITPLPTTCSEYNETYFKWTYSVQIRNDRSDFIVLRNIQLDQLILDNENGTIAGIKINGVKGDYINIVDNEFYLMGFTNILSKQIATVEVSFLSQNKL